MDQALGRIFYFVRWGIPILLIGLVTGGMCVFLPPPGLAGVVAFAAVCLLWALPELRTVPEKPLRRMFFITVAVQLCVPNYYAIATGIFPWISIRRLFTLAVIVLFGLTIAGSKSARIKISATLGSNRVLSIAVIGFLVTMVLSFFTSVNLAYSLKEFSDGFLNWYVPLFVGLLVVRTEADVVLLFKVIAIADIIDGIGGAIEFAMQHRVYFDLIPKSMLDLMLVDNPSLARMVYGISIRNGYYRASSIFSVSLSFGEFAAMVVPIAAYFVLYGRNRRDRALGVATGISSLVGIFTSGARGGYTSLLVAMPIMAFIWTVRYSKANPRSLTGIIMAGVFVAGTICALAAVESWPRLHDVVIGSEYDGAESTAARYEQWDLAIPHILANPVTGHGMGNGGAVVGYHADTVPSIDSYILTLLVETGVPGLLLFFATMAIAAWRGMRLYLTDPDEGAAVGGALACSLIAYMVYRIALSQTESNNLAFIVVGLIFALEKLAFDRSKCRSHMPVRGSLGSHKGVVANERRAFRADG